jgi:hypothetical protein
MPLVPTRSDAGRGFDSVQTFGFLHELNTQVVTAV